VAILVTVVVLVVVDTVIGVGATIVTGVMLQHEQALSYAEVPGQAEAYVGTVGGVSVRILRTSSPPRLLTIMETVVVTVVVVVEVLLFMYC
jgi:hypothetical protein